MARSDMKAGQGDLGEDVVTPPRPLTEEPPADRFCDLVLTGGVASGVVYPWAVLELARHYRFKSIGGTSVGAMAAALAAAAEYGRRTGHRQAFEVLRRVPGRLAQEVDPDGGTRLLSLFQPVAQGQRLFDWFVRTVRRHTAPHRSADGQALPPDQVSRAGRRRVYRSVLDAARLWASPALRILGPALALLWAVQLAELHHQWTFTGWSWALLVPVWSSLGTAAGGTVLTGVALLVLGGFEFWRDLRDGLIGNGLGLCRGGPSGDASADRTRPALVAWLHEGIQRAAGLAPDDAPLTFRDLWNAPEYPGGPRLQIDEAARAGLRSIDLQMITTNVTLGRPFRLPLHGTSTRLFFVVQELEAYFPAPILAAMVAAARPYRPLSPADPPASEATARFLELPGADLPVVVAARMSLSFPLLFSAVPLYAVDHEVPQRAARTLERCWFSDGGLCSNFPIHLFDAAVPRWPTFGMWLGDRSPYRPDQAFWLPERPTSGRGEMRRRFDPDDAAAAKRERALGPAGFLGGFLASLVLTAKDWGDFTRMRMPHVRNRVARLFLREGEGGLNIGMSRATMLRMADAYGTAVGRHFVQQYGEQPDGEPGLPWREQRWVRLTMLIEGLRELVHDVRGAAGENAYTLPVDDLLRLARTMAAGAALPTERPVSPQQAHDIERLLQAVYAFEDSLAESLAGEPFHSDPRTELRLRPAL